jgi:capsule polysaccharide export protein KpsE/RkpR
MTDSNYPRVGSTARERENSRNRASAFFKEKVTRNVATYQQMETDRLIGETKIAKLKALRLAKEEADREETRLAEPNQPNGRGLAAGDEENSQAK